MEPFSEFIARATGQPSGRRDEALRPSDGSDGSTGDGGGPRGDGGPVGGRRGFLVAGGCVAASLLAGCAGLGQGGRGDDPGPASPTGSDGETPTATATPTGTPATPRSPEVDVVGLSYRPGDATYELHVTLSAPEGSGGADRWQVETLAGERIARASFSAPRTGRFRTTRTVEVDDASAIVVRGHARASGYGGQAMLADLDTARIVAERQGHEPTSFEDYAF